MKQKLFILIFSTLFNQFINAQVDFIWGKQFGTDKDDKTRNLYADSSDNIYVVGKTKGVIGKVNFGKNDAFIVKTDSAANMIWSIQIGSVEDDEFTHVVTDNSGNIYATGFMGVDEQNQSTKNQDIIVVKLNSVGEIIWQKQYGTDGSDVGANIVVDTNGDLYITGQTNGLIGSTSYGLNDCFILHLDNNGNQLHVLQFGTSGNDEAYGIIIEQSAKIYVCGSTEGNLAADNAGKYDLFWGVFSKQLKQLDMKQYGTNENDYAAEIKTDSENNVYIAGNTEGNMFSQQQGNSDAFLQKWNENGEIIWTKQFGTSNWDGIHSIDVVKEKGIMVSGCIDYPNCKSFVTMVDEQGNVLWDRKIIAQGKGGGSCGKDIFVNCQGYIYHAGYTGANLFSNLIGEHDLFLVKLKMVPSTCLSH